MIEVDNDKVEMITRYRRYSNLRDCFVQDKTEEDVPAHTHPIKAATSHYGVKPIHDYRCTEIHAFPRTRNNVNVEDFPKLNTSP